MTRFLSRCLMQAVLYAALAGHAMAEAGKKTVFIATWRGCEGACQGFQDDLRDKGVDVEFVLRDAGSNKDNLAGWSPNSVRRNPIWC